MAGSKPPQKHFYQALDLLHLPVKERVLALENEMLQDPEYSGFDTFSLKNSGLALLDAQPNRTTWQLDIGSHLCNKSGNLHGGAAATIMDNLTSTALITIMKDGFLDGGHVSRTITMSYLRPVPDGSRVRVECEVQSAGRNTANVEGRLYVNDKLAVTCVHDKAVFARAKKSAKL